MASQELLTDTPAEALSLTARVLDFEKERSKFLSDASSDIGEGSDFLEEMDLTPLVRTIQSRIKASASMSEAAVIAMYRTLDSFQEEYKMRLMTREEYAADAVKDQEAHVARVSADMSKFTTVMTGSDYTQR